MRLQTKKNILQYRTLSFGILRCFNERGSIRFSENSIRAYRVPLAAITGLYAIMVPMMAIALWSLWEWWILASAISIILLSYIVVLWVSTRRRQLIIKGGRANLISNTLLFSRSQVFSVDALRFVRAHGTIYHSGASIRERCIAILSDDIIIMAGLFGEKEDRIYESAISMIESRFRVEHDVRLEVHFVQHWLVS